MFLNLFSRLPKSFHSGFLPEQDGHSVFFHQFGNPDGVPILCFHGGPGSKSKVKHAQLFDLKKYRVILFDQRGCGKSQPLGSIQNNTTADLIQDAKRLLDHLHIDQITLYGASWGSTLALLFAHIYPEKVQKMLLGKIFLGRQQDVDGIWQRVKMFYPDFFQKIRDAVPHDKNMRRYYADLVLSENHHDNIRSFLLYGQCECLLETFDPVHTVPEPDDAKLQAYRIYMHYDRHNYGLIENQILDHIQSISHIPTLIVHNRMDLICPVEQAWLLAQEMKQVKLVIIPDFGHSSDFLHKAIKKEIAAFL